MMRHPRLYKLVSFLVLIVVFSSGCTASDVQTTHLNSYIPSETQQTAPELTAVEAGIVCTGLGDNFLISNNHQLHSICELIYDSLFIKTGAASYEESIVKTYTVIEKEDSVVLWSFSIRTDIVFSDSGTKLTAKDCVDTINYIKNNGGYYAENLSSVISCSQTSPYSFEIECKSDCDDLVKSLVFPIIPSSSLSQPSILLTEGSGSFVVEEYEQDKNMLLLIGNTDSWKRTVRISELNIHIFGTNEDLYACYANDELDYAVFSSEFRIPAVTSKDTTILLNPGDSIKLLELNKDSGILSDLDMRETVISAINRDQLARLIQPSQAIEINRVQGTGIAETKNSFVYECDLQRSKYCFESYLRQNPEIEPEGIILEIVVESVFDNKTDYNIALFIQEDLNRIGVQTNISLLNSAEYQAALEHGSFDIAIRNCHVRDNTSIRFYDYFDLPESAYDSVMAGEEDSLYCSDEELNQIEEFIYRQQHILPLYQDADCILYRNLELNAMISGPDHAFSVLKY